MKRLPLYLEADIDGRITGRAALPPRRKPLSATRFAEAVLAIIDRILAGFGFVVLGLVGLVLLGAAIAMAILLQGAWLGSVLSIAAHFR